VQEGKKARESVRKTVVSGLAAGAGE